MRAGETGGAHREPRCGLGLISCCLEPQRDTAAPGRGATCASSGRVLERLGVRCRAVASCALGRDRAVRTVASGTGKTLAAEVLAGELSARPVPAHRSRAGGQQVHRRDRGESATRVFEAAEDRWRHPAVRRGGQRCSARAARCSDSHDRYANIEVSYLLQKMEPYRGLAILTSNMKEAIDAAFGRRLRFIIDFPFPDASQRAAIWRAAFPATAPVDQLDIARLARLNIAGGHIRSIAINAAFRAAGDRRRIGMEHVIYAARGQSTQSSAARPASSLASPTDEPHATTHQAQDPQPPARQQSAERCAACVRHGASHLGRAGQREARSRNVRYRDDSACCCRRRKDTPMSTTHASALTRAKAEIQ